MNYALGSIDRNLKPLKPRLFLCRPNRQTIATLNNVIDFDCTVYTRLYDLNEIHFSIPSMVEKRKEWIKNPLLDKIKEKYLIRLQLGDKTDWYIIQQSNVDADETTDKKSFVAMFLPYELRDKRFRQLKLESKNATEALTTYLSVTNWTIGYIDPYFDTLYRTYEVTSTTVLDCVIQVANKLDGLLEWDTVNRKVSLKKKDSIVYKGLHFSMRKYLQKLSQDTQTDEMVTRLYPYGKDDLTINEANPTGQSYIEDFSYFMYPFERDENRNVIKHSDYMSDELCHALLDYQEAIQSVEGQFSSLLSQKTDKETQITAKQNEIDELELELAQIRDRQDIQKSNQSLTYQEISYSGSKTTIQPAQPFKDTNTYAVFMYTPIDVDVKLDNQDKTIPINQWAVVGKIKGQQSTTLEISGQGTGTIKVYMLEIESTEYDTQNNDSDLINKYIPDYKQAQIDVKNGELQTLKDEEADIDSLIQALRNEIAIERYFTPELLEERNQFIIEAEYSEPNYITAQALYEGAKQKFVDLQLPKTVFSINVVNFLEVVECQRDWNKLVLGDYVKIKHSFLNIDIMAQILEITYNYSEGTIDLTIGNVKNLSDLSPERKIVNMIYQHQTSSTTVEINKGTWDSVSDVKSDVDSILNEAWDATKRKIIAGTNESVTIDSRGIRITNPTDSNNYLVANHAVLAITNDGGKTWKNAITTDGVIGERIVGQIIIGENLKLYNKSGSFVVDDKGVTIDGSALFITSGQKSVQYDLNTSTKETPTDTYIENNQIKDIPATPVIPPDQQSINHVLNPDGTATISFEWGFDGDGNEYNIDGFIVYLYSSSSSGSYQFGTNADYEHQYVLNDFQRALILYNVPKDNFYTFGVQAYRIVDKTINPDGILKSAIAQPTIPTENPYCPSYNTAFDGDILGTITTTDLSSISKRVDKSIQAGVAYNGVVIDTNSGLVVTRGDNKARSIFNATDGIKIQQNKDGIWTDKFYVDTNGIINAKGLVIKNEDDQVILDATTNTINLDNLTVTGTIKADNIEAKSITADLIADKTITLSQLATEVTNMVNNWTKNGTLEMWSIIDGTGTMNMIDDPDKANSKSVQITTSDKVTVASDYINVDPTKTYKVTASIYTSAQTGTRIFGFYCYDENKQMIPVDEWDVNSHQWLGDNSNPKFWFESGKTVDDNGNVVYLDMEAYILSSGIQDNGIPRGRNVYRHFKLPPNAKYVRIIFINQDNGGVQTTVKVWSPTMIVSDSPIFTFSQGYGGILTLGGKDNGNGELYVKNENDENHLIVNKDGVYASTFVAGEINAPNIMTINNDNITYYIDPTNGDDENDGLQPSSAFKSINRPFQVIPQLNNGQIRVEVVGTNQHFYEDLVVDGFIGKGTITIDFMDTTNTLHGIIKFESTFNDCYLYNGTLSYVNNQINTSSGALYVRHTYLYINNFAIQCNNAIAYGLYAYGNAVVDMRNSSVWNTNNGSGIIADTGSRIYLQSVSGNGHVDGVRVKGPSILGAVDNTTVPAGTIKTVNNYQGGVANVTVAAYNGSTQGNTTPTTTIVRYNSNGSASWRDQYGGWRNDNDDVYQGSAGYGTHKGFWFFPSLSAIQGKTISRMRLYCHRKGEGGQASSQDVYFRYHTYSSESSARASSNPTVSSSYQIRSFSWNEEKWIDLPSSWFSYFSNGTAKGIAIYAGSPYVIFYGDAILEITYS